MRKIILLLLLSGSNLQAQWANIGDSFLTESSARKTNIVVNEFGIYTAFIENSKANVKKYDGTDWVSVGLPDFSPANIATPSLALDGNTPFIAFRDTNNGSKISVMKFNGTGWEYVGPQGFSPGSVQYTKIRINNGVPYVAFQNSSNGKGSVMSYDGTSWNLVGNEFIGGNSIWNLQLEFSNDNIPYLSFREFISTGVNKLNVVKLVANIWEYEGASVENLGTNSDGSNPLVNSTIAFEPLTNVPFISYIIRNPSDSSSQVVTKKLVAGNWLEVGNPIADAFNTIDGGLKLTFLQNKPVVAFCGFNGDLPDVKIRVNSFDGVNWASLDGNAFASIGSIGTENLPFDNELDLYSYNNELYLSYSEDAPEVGRIRVRKFTPTALSNPGFDNYSGIKVYPNPTNGSVKIAFEDASTFGNAHYNVYDIAGRTINTGTLNSMSEIDLSAVSSGVYFIQFAGVKKAVRIIKQ